MYAISSPRFLLYEDNVLCATYTLPCRPSPCKAFVPEWPSVQGRHVSLWLPRSAHKHSTTVDVTRKVAGVEGCAASQHLLQGKATVVGGVTPIIQILL